MKSTCLSGLSYKRIDSGIARYMRGVDGIKYAANVRPTEPCTFSTAGGAIELSMEGDALLRNGSVLSNCLLNEASDLNLNENSEIDAN